LVSVLVSVLSTSVAMVYAGQKTIIISEEESDSLVEEEALQTVKWAIDVSKKHNDSFDELVIYLPQYVDAYSEVDTSLRYDDSTLTVWVKNTRESFFLSNPPVGNYEYVESATGAFDGEITTIEFKLKENCVADISYYNKEIRIKFTPLSEIEGTVVVLDPGHGGGYSGTRVGEISEKDIVLAIAKKVRDYAKDKPYTVLLTRDGDATISTEGRIKAINALNGDYYVGIHLSSDVEDVKNFGMSGVYNSSYYNNGLENAEFADILLRNAATETSNRANGLTEAGEEELLLKVMDVPSAILYAGFLSNENEAKLLSTDEYISKIAKGIVNALDEVIE